ncbi:MAG: hypothetical protein ABSE48_18460 [Verrucomicrobiota bacterium]|jgi:hypothetical protein
MTHWVFGWLALVFAAQLSLPSKAALLQSKVLENDVAYLRVGEAGKELADEVSAAEIALASSNKTIGTVLDLRSADGDGFDAAKAVAEFFAEKKSPLAVLVNDGTRNAADRLALDVRTAQAGLIFGSATTDLKPDISVAVMPADESIFLKNPYALPTTNSAADETTSNFVPFIDHTSEADLVRQKIKDGDEDETTAPVRVPPSRPVIRDPALARAVDFLKALAILQPARG